MDANLKKILKAVVLEMRHALEGYYDNAGKWFPGDLEQRLAEIGVRKDRESAPVDELALADEDIAARKIIDAYISLRQQAGVDRADAVAEYVREAAYTWANRLVALRCMEARELLDDEVIVGREAYGGRSLVHHRLAQTAPELCTGEDDGRFAMLFRVFAERAETLPTLFDPESPSIALRPSPPALQNCLAWLSGVQKVRSHDPASDAVFAAPDALGWAYQYWNTEEKDRVFETVRTQKGAKIQGADIIPATQLYTEDYMVKFLVQNSLGATWMGMHPDSPLVEDWEYYVRDADRAPAVKKPLGQLTLLDPACGSGHFLLEAFDMFYAMYQAAGELTEPAEICQSILENNLFGIDIDERAIQIAEASLWMKAEERAFGFPGATTNLVAATSSHLQGESWERFLATLEKEPSVVRVLRKFAKSIEHIDELGSLARPAEDLTAIVKTEHRLWEDQVRTKKEANFLFPDMVADALDGQLPFDEITDEQFGHRMMNRAIIAIDAFTKDARETGEFNDQLLAGEARTGFRLLEMMGKTYGIVTANPPYMHNSNFGEVLKEYLYEQFPDSCLDVYGAFIERSIELTDANGMVGLVTQQSFMFLERHLSLRELIFSRSSPHAFAHLGPHAFQDISGVVVNVALLVVEVTDDDKSGTFLDLTLESAKSSALKRTCQDDGISRGATSRRSWSDFDCLPGRPIAFRLHPSEVAQFDHPLLECVADIPSGMVTGSNSRYVRGWWEGRSSLTPYMKGGESQAWFGNYDFAIDSSPSGFSRMKSSRTFRAAGAELYRKSGITYSSVSTLMRARYMEAGAIWDCGGPVVIPHEPKDEFWCLSLLNSAYATQILYSLNPTINIKTNDLKRLPVSCQSARENLAEAGRFAVQIAQRVDSLSSSSRSYTPSEQSVNSFSSRVSNEILLRLAAMVTLSVVQGVVDELVFASANLDSSLHSSYSRQFLAFPLLVGAIEIPFELLETSATKQMQDLFENATRCLPIVNRNREVEDQVRRSYEQSAPEVVDATISDESVEDANAQISEMRVAIPPQNIVESISSEIGVHPLGIFSFIARGIREDGWRNRKLEQLIGSSFIETLALQAIGHRWPMQREPQELGESWADGDGIVPLTRVEKETTLEVRIDQRFKNRLAFATEFRELMNKSLEDWLTTEFFSHHVRQFKRRPIAWQLQSSSFTARKTPAFACLAYYHRMDVDAIPKIRSQYTGPLKLRWETEMRGIAATPAGNRTDQQSQRAVELEEAIAELQAFDEKLADIAITGFGPTKLRPTLRQYACDDAMLAIKARWLKRLSQSLDQPPGEQAASPLAQWQAQAAETGLHPELAGWIGEALGHLDYFCSQVGPPPPQAKQTPADPTAADFAEWIRPATADMATRSIALACEAWWGQFAAAVLAPLKQRIKTLKAQQKELNAAIRENRQPVLDAGTAATLPTGDTPLLSDDQAQPETTALTPAAIKGRVKELKAEVKRLTDEMNRKAGQAQAIRDTIETYRSDAPEQWHDWLASGPLFDQVASSDDRRAPPKTIAEFIAQESQYAPDINDGVRVNIAPLQKAGILAANVLAAKDINKAIADRAHWRADERRWVREGKLPQCGWWPEVEDRGVQ